MRRHKFEIGDLVKHKWYFHKNMGIVLKIDDTHMHLTKDCEYLVYCFKSKEKAHLSEKLLHLVSR